MPRAGRIPIDWEMGLWWKPKDILLTIEDKEGDQ